MSSDTRSDADRVLDEVKSVFADLHGGRAAAVSLQSAPVGSIFRTPGLKIRRAATREAFEAGRLTPGSALPLARSISISRWRRLASARRLGGAVASAAFGAYVWVLLAVIGIPLWVAVQLPISRHLRWTLTRFAGRTLSKLTGIHLRVTGTFPSGGPAVVVANHSSFVDALALLLGLPPTAVFVTSSDMEHQRFIGSFLRRLGCPFVYRGKADRSAEDLKVMIGLIETGHDLVTFPEGSIAAVVGPRPFHLGAFAVAIAAGCPVVPVGIRGTRDILRPGTSSPHRFDAEVVIGSPIQPVGEGFSGDVDLSHCARQAVVKLSQQVVIDQSDADR